MLFRVTNFAEKRMFHVLYLIYRCLQITYSNLHHQPKKKIDQKTQTEPINPKLRTIQNKTEFPKKKISSHSVSAHSSNSNQSTGADRCGAAFRIGSDKRFAHPAPGNYRRRGRNYGNWEAPNRPFRTAEFQPEAKWLWIGRAPVLYGSD